MEYKITYKITSEFITYVHAGSKKEARETFREFDIGHDIAEEHGDIGHDEVEVVSVHHNRDEGEARECGHISMARPNNPCTLTATWGFEEAPNGTAHQLREMVYLCTRHFNMDVKGNLDRIFIRTSEPCRIRW